MEALLSKDAHLSVYFSLSVITTRPSHKLVQTSKGDEVFLYE